MKRFRHILTAAFLIFSAASAGLAQAGVVTFDDVPVYSNDVTFSSDGFTFSSPTWIGYVARGDYCWPACPDNGTNTFISGNSPSVLTMTQADGKAFNLTGFDGGGTHNFHLSSYPDDIDFIPTHIDLVGLRVDGTIVSQSFAIDRLQNADGRLSLTQFLVDDSFTNLYSVAFSASGSTWESGNGFTLDNIVATPVPEPAGLALLLAGLGVTGLAAGRARRHSRNHR